MDVGGEPEDIWRLVNTLGTDVWSEKVDRERLGVLVSSSPIAVTEKQLMEKISFSSRL